MNRQSVLCVLYRMCGDRKYVLSTYCSVAGVGEFIARACINNQIKLAALSQANKIIVACMVQAANEGK